MPEVASLGLMTTQKIQSMVSTARESAWQEKFELLMAYKNEVGDVPVPKNRLCQGVNLGTWLATQRKAFANGRLSPERSALLGDAGVLASFRLSWADAYALLVSYKELHGNAQVPRHHTVDGYRLGRWLAEQKVLRNLGSLLPDRWRLLDEAGVIWSTPLTAWDDALDILAAYKAEHGDANASDGLIYQGFPLGTWLQTQRRGYRLGRISTERVARLDGLGMVWNFNDANWERNFALVIEYAKVHGTTVVAQGFVTAGGVKLGYWYQRQLALAKCGTLAPERRACLETLGVRLSTGPKP